MAAHSVRGMFRTTVGQKAIMAVSGGVLVVYLVGHMVGNLKAFLGRESFDGYARWLRTAGEPALPPRAFLTAAETVLAVAVALHMWAAISLARRARRARPVRYAARPRALEHRYATHVMRYGGAVIALFVVWHLLDLTFGAVNPAGRAADSYGRVVAGFAPSRWYVTAFYLVAVALVGTHLRHGVWSACRTLGLRGRRLLADAVAAALTLGFASVPLAVTIGVIQ
jgi:succinate dehydrogenase / fumarate reductase, cytochrome b subunit